MQLKRILATILFLAILVFLWIQLYRSLNEISDLRKEYEELAKIHTKLVEENSKIEKEIEYYSYPENMEKLLRSRFNYKKPGEKMIIVVPEENQ